MREREAEARALDQVLGHLDAVVLHETLPGFETHRLEEGTGHRTADQDAVHLWQQRLDDVDLAGDLGPAEDRDEGALRLFQRVAEVVELLLHQQARDGGSQECGNACRAAVRAMRRSERVVDV